jgi:hypothetical protein
MKHSMPHGERVAINQKSEMRAHLIATRANVSPSTA